MPRISSITNFSNFTGVYCFGFNGKEGDNSTSADSYDFGARILDSRIGRWFVIDQLANCNHSIGEYTYIGNSPILLVDMDGKWWGVTTVFFEVQAGIGLCYGFNYVKRRGFSSDEVGTTHFVVESVVTIQNQKLDEGQIGQPVLGVTLGAGVGFAIDANHDTFDEMIGCRTTKSTNGVFSQALPKFDSEGNLKTPSLELKFGVGIEANSMGFGLTFGAQMGVMINFVETYVVESISVSDDEEDVVDEMSVLPSQVWTTSENKSPVYNMATGEVTGFSSTLLVDGAATNIQLYSGAMKNEKGETVPDNVWYTLDYQNKAKEANKEE